MSKQHTVTWTVDVEAESTRDAAWEVARTYFQPRIATGEYGSACVFQVRLETEVHSVTEDLADPTSAERCAHRVVASQGKSEAMEVAEAIFEEWKAFWPLSRQAARQLAKHQMAGETQTVIDNVADALVWLNHMAPGV